MKPLEGATESASESYECLLAQRVIILSERANYREDSMKKRGCVD
jgi:hypothetical protein